MDCITERDSRREAAEEAGRRYWPRGFDALEKLPIPRIDATPASRWVEVPLPHWAADLGVGRPASLLVDAACLQPGQEEPYQRCDWWCAADWLLESQFEREFERSSGPIHSYAFRLRGIDTRLFDRAWVNRIYLFLRRWAARGANREESDLFGPLPDPEFDLSHDVDAVSKTLAIRGKQTAFHLFNFGQNLLRMNLRRAASLASKVARFAWPGGDYWCIPQICALEEKFGRRSVFHFYGGHGLRPWTPKQALMDPSYDVSCDRIRNLLRELRRGGWEVGLHPAFDSFADTRRLSAERSVLEKAVDAPVSRVRQHWLRFTWQSTWRAQADAGLSIDSTLGFNDRCGFRNSAALRFRPRGDRHTEPCGMEALPMVIMDSHFYDYHPMSPAERQTQMAHWINEVKQVHGQASLLWHCRVMHPDYGWADGYRELLELLNKPIRRHSGERRNEMPTHQAKRGDVHVTS